MEALTRIQRSVDTLKELYSGAIALALYVAIGGLASRTGDKLAIHLEHFPWFLALFVTLVPFYHGAVRHLDETYIFAKEKPKALALMVDYLMLFSEAGLLVWLGLLISEPESFTKYYAYLIGVDIIWGVAVYFLTPDGFVRVWRWVLINLITLVVIEAVSYTSFLDRAKPGFLIWVAVARSILDYVWNWKMYFPDEAAST